MVTRVKDNALSVDATNDNFTDPVEGVDKKLRVEYTVDGRPTLPRSMKDDSSYGFRHNRNAHHAVARCRQAALNGYAWVIEA